jgi:hypothetical protein
MAPFGATTRDENTRSFFWERHLQGSELMRWGRQIRAATVRERWSRDHRSVTVAALIGVVLQRSFPWDPSGPQQGMKFDDRFLERHFKGERADALGVAGTGDVRSEPRPLGSGGRVTTAP